MNVSVLPFYQTDYSSSQDDDPALHIVWRHNYTEIIGSMFERSDGSVFIAGYVWTMELGWCTWYVLNMVNVHEPGYQLWQKYVEYNFQGYPVQSDDDYFFMLGVTEVHQNCVDPDTDSILNTSIWFFEPNGTPVWNQTLDLGQVEYPHHPFKFDNDTLLFFVNHDSDNETQIKVNEEGTILAYQNISLPGRILTHIPGFQHTLLVVNGSYSDSMDITWFQLQRINLKGDIYWSKNYTRNHYVYINRAIQTADNGFLICGTKGNIEESDLYFLRTDSIGNELWNITYDNLFRDRICDVSQIANGDYLAVATSEVRNWTYAEGTCLRFSDNGTLLWTYDLGEGQVSEVLTLETGDHIIRGHVPGRSAMWLMRLTEVEPLISHPLSNPIFVVIVEVVIVGAILILLLVIQRKRKTIKEELG